MKAPLDRTKVVLRHLPPSISQPSLMEQIDSRFAGCYNWVSFHPGKTSQKHKICSRAYIDFKRPDDVIEFAEFFDGHVFVNEKGTQFKTVVEYAPSQCVPKQWSKKDGREGTIFKDPEYMEFLEFLAKPVENLPSADIQLERKEAEQAGAARDASIVTPLMDYIRQKRAVISGARRSAFDGKLAKRVSGASGGSSSSTLSKRGSEKTRIPSIMYVLKDRAKGASSKNKSVVPKQDDQRHSDQSACLAAVSETDALNEESGGSGPTDLGKKKILLLKGKEKEIPKVYDVLPVHQGAVSPVLRSSSSAAVKQDQRCEAGGSIIRTILLKRDNHQNLSSVVQSEQYETTNSDKDRGSLRLPTVQLLRKDANGTLADRKNSHNAQNEKRDRQMRNKDKPDRAVWAPLRRSSGSKASDEGLTSSTSQHALDSSEGHSVEVRNDTLNTGTEFKIGGRGRGSHSFTDNEANKRGGLHGSTHIKDSNGSSVVEGKPTRRGSIGYGSHEKRVWVQKSRSGS